MRVFVPPIKSQGIKTKLVEWISSNVEDIQFERWVEPFMGTGVVAFNIRPKKALLCDSNPHLINKNEIMSYIIMTHPVTPSVFSPSLREERGESPIYRASG